MKPPSLETTLMLATRTHYGRNDEGGHPWILHSIRVMMKQVTPARQRVALMHDVLENTDLTMAHLCEYGFPQEEMDAIDALTIRPGENYQQDFIERVVLNRMATEVKLDVLLDYMDISRFGMVTGAYQERIDYRWKPALRRLWLGKTAEPTLVQIQPLNQSARG